jgi:DDE superfamily endonuclease
VRCNNHTLTVAFGPAQKWLRGLRRRQDANRCCGNSVGITSNGSGSACNNQDHGTSTPVTKNRMPSKKMLERVEEKREQAKQEGFTFSVWTMDEQRLGLKPVIRRVWAIKGSKPTAVVNHRYEWLYVYGFVQPETGQTYFLILPFVNVAVMNLALAHFALDLGLNSSNRALLVLDQAGWHVGKDLLVPEGLELLFLPSHSPERPNPVSSRVKSQDPTVTSRAVMSTQGFRSRTTAFKIPSNLRIHATKATFLAFLTLKPAPNGLGSLPSPNQAFIHDFQRRVEPYR